MPKVRQPLGRLTPWVWSVELTRGCNLACWHCTARIFPEDKQLRFMSESDWVAICEVMRAATPRRRLELAQGGEPTLHPRLLEFLRIARRITPTTQIQVTTNGVTVLKGRYRFLDFFEAGANSVYVDMYGPEEEFVARAKESGAEWYLYNEPKVGSPGHKMANTFYDDPSMRLVILQNNPHDRLLWRRAGRLSTFLNHIDWKVAMPFGLVPVRESYQRRCTLPQRYVSVSWDGYYLFCCIDFWCESAGELGSVRDGVEGFRKYWFGRLMQSIRRQLHAGNRGVIPYCSRCNCAFSKCDMIGIWPKGATSWWWDGSGEWKTLPAESLDHEVFAPGWEKARRLRIPTEEEEEQALRTSKQRLILSRPKK